MSRDQLAWFLRLTALSALLVLAAVSVSAATGHPGGSGAGESGAGESAAPPCPEPVEFRRDAFRKRPVIRNKWLPLTPGTQLTLEGRANRGGGLLPHTVTFTVTDLTKVINGVPTVVVWDVDMQEGSVAEAELAFFAQDKDGNVWNLGEYPEEYEDGVFLGAPNAWIAGLEGAKAGIHMRRSPPVGASWLQGFAPEIDFLDCAEVVSKREKVCVPVSCYERVLLTHETSPLDPNGGVQTKYHARDVGIVQIGALDDPEGETLVLSRLVSLGPAELAAARNAALRLDESGYLVSEVYAKTRPAKAPENLPALPAAQGAPGGGSVQSGAVVPAPTAPPVGQGDAVAPTGQAEQARGRSARARSYTHKVDHPLVPLTSVRRTVFEGREGDTKTRVATRVLKRTRRIAGVRTAIVDVREFEDGKLVEHTKDYYAQDRRGNVWYFGEHVDDIENGKVVGHEGQWFAGRGNAKAGLFMPAEPKLGRVFEQERAPGVAEDRSKVVAVGVNVETPAGRFDDCIRTRDYAPLDRRAEFKFYCAGVGLVREKPADGRLDLVRYR